MKLSDRSLTRAQAYQSAVKLNKIASPEPKNSTITAGKRGRAVTYYPP